MRSGGGKERIRARKDPAPEQPWYKGGDGKGKADMRVGRGENEVRNQDRPEMPPEIGSVEKRKKWRLQAAARNEFLDRRQHEVKPHQRGDIMT